jgi:hypothetical protein
MPMQVVRFEDNGTDLLPRIAKHYSTGAHISPIICSRRNICIIRDNATYKVDAYNAYDGCSSAFYATSLYVEMPYLCFVYARRVEVDIEPEHGVTLTLNVSTGNDYILDCVPKAKDRNEPRPSATTRSVAEEIQTYGNDLPDGHANTPAVYVRADLESTFACYKAIRIYGEAIALV